MSVSLQWHTVQASTTGLYKDVVFNDVLIC
jgi:hypothetical protein